MNDIWIAIITGSFGLATGIVTTYMMYYKNSKKENIQSCNSLKQHPFFYKIDILIDETNRTFKLSNKGKEKVFKEIISNQLKIYKKYLNVVVETVEHNDVKDLIELYNVNLKCYKEIRNELHCYYLNENYTDDEKKILGIVMSKYESWNKENFRNTIESVTQICNSPFYGNENIEIKTSVILDVYLNSAIETINSAENTLNNINGDLKGLVYKNIRL